MLYVFILCSSFCGLNMCEVEPCLFGKCELTATGFKVSAYLQKRLGKFSSLFLRSVIVAKGRATSIIESQISDNP